MSIDISEIEFSGEQEDDRAYGRRSYPRALIPDHPRNRLHWLDLRAHHVGIPLPEHLGGGVVPLPRTARSILVDYAKRRDAHLIPHVALLLCRRAWWSAIAQYVHRVFWQLSRQTGLRDSTHTGPRLHDFPHRFAV